MLELIQLYYFGGGDSDGGGGGDSDTGNQTDTKTESAKEQSNPYSGNKPGFDLGDIFGPNSVFSGNTTTTDSSGNSTTTDREGNIVSTTIDNPDGSKTTYDGEGNVTSFTDSKGQTYSGSSAAQANDQAKNSYDQKNSMLDSLQHAHDVSTWSDQTLAEMERSLTPSTSGTEQNLSQAVNDVYTGKAGTGEDRRTYLDETYGAGTYDRVQSILNENIYDQFTRSDGSQTAPLVNWGDAQAEAANSPTSSATTEYPTFNSPERPSTTPTEHAPWSTPPASSSNPVSNSGGNNLPNSGGGYTPSSDSGGNDSGGTSGGTYTETTGNIFTPTPTPTPEPVQPEAPANPNYTPPWSNYRPSQYNPSNSGTTLGLGQDPNKASLQYNRGLGEKATILSDAQTKAFKTLNSKYKGAFRSVTNKGKK
jgi:YD repeat-containing protein